MVMKNILVLAVVAIGLTGCNPKVAEETEASEVPAAAGLDGVWHTGCIEDGDSSYIKSVQVEDGQLSVATLRYKQTLVCDQSKLETTVIVAGNIALKDEGAYEWTLSAYVGMPNTPELAQDLNDSSMCGFTDWASNSAKMIFGCTISENMDLANVTYGTVHYGKFEIKSDVTPNTLQLESRCAVAGYDFICPTAEDRPATLGSEVYYRE